MENRVPWDQLQAHGWTYCFFEDLCLRPHEELMRLSSVLGGGRANTRFKGSVKPMLSKGQGQGAQKSILNNWQFELSDQEIKQILDIVESFGFTFYGDSPYPDKGRLDSPFLEVAGYG